MKTKKGEGYWMPKRERLYPTKRESDRMRELKKQYRIRDEVVVKSRDTLAQEKPKDRKV